MTRVPKTSPSERDRQQQIRRLEGLLRGLERVPAFRREDELADERAADIRGLLADLGAPGYERPERTSDGAVTLIYDTL